jgi:hypothetical protein
MLKLQELHDPLVYYVRRDWLIKIGTTTHFRQRMSALDVDEVLAVEPGSYDLEDQRHEQFAADRFSGDWFRPSAALLAHASALRAVHDAPRLGKWKTRGQYILRPEEQAVLDLLPPLLIPVRPGTVERFAQKVVIDGASGCWRRMAGHDEHGYGMFHFEGTTRRTHIASHLMFVGRIPDGYEVDHVKKRGCRYRDCVRPAHLEAVTQLENTRRSDSVGGKNSRVTRCPAGHEYTPENTYWLGPRKSRRDCKICTRARAKAQRDIARGGEPQYVHWNTLKTHCRADHLYEGENLYVAPNGDRLCMECKRVNQRRRRAVKQQQGDTLF